MKRLFIAALLWIFPLVGLAALTPAQLQTLKTAIVADNTLNSQPQTPDGAFAIADALNQASSPADNVWRTNCSVQAINDSINWSLYTPADALDGTSALTNRLLAIQTKQMNLQLMLTGRDTIDTSKAQVRAGLRDAVIQVPAGAGGASVSPGGSSGATVLAACVRNSLRIESILSTGSATTGSTTAKLMGYEGAITYQDVLQARALP